MYVIMRKDFSSVLQDSNGTFCFRHLDDAKAMAEKFYGVAVSKTVAEKILDTKYREV